MMAQFARTLLWFAAFVLIQLCAFAAVLAMDPGGFDACDPASVSGQGGLQVAVGVGAMLVSFGAAIWFLRRWYLAISLVFIGLAALQWIWLLDDSASVC